MFEYFARNLDEAYDILVKDPLDVFATNFLRQYPFKKFNVNSCGVMLHDD